MLYTLCGQPGCPLFVEPNEVDQPGLAKYVHLHRGDEADESIDDSHEAVPGETRDLNWWRQNGPENVRARFTP